MNEGQALAEARRKKAVARAHKRAQDHHRKQAKAVMGELEEFCQRHGIQMDFVLEERAKRPAPPDEFDRAVIQRDRDRRPETPAEVAEIAREVRRDLENNQARRPSDRSEEDPYEIGPRPGRQERRHSRRAKRAAGRRSDSRPDRAGA